MTSKWPLNDLKWPIRTWKHNFLTKSHFGACNMSFHIMRSDLFFVNRPFYFYYFFSNLCPRNLLQGYIWPSFYSEWPNLFFDLFFFFKGNLFLIVIRFFQWPFLSKWFLNCDSFFHSVKLKSQIKNPRHIK